MPPGAPLNLQDYFGGRAPIAGGETVAAIVGLVTGFTPKAVAPFISASPVVAMYMLPEALGGLAPNNWFGTPEYLGIWELLAGMTTNTGRREWLKAWSLKFEEHGQKTHQQHIDTLAGLPPEKFQTLEKFLTDPRGRGRSGQEEMRALIREAQIVRARNNQGDPFTLSGALQVAIEATAPPPMMIAQNAGDVGAAGEVRQERVCINPPDPNARR